jgi:hypothetical protein
MLESGHITGLGTVKTTVEGQETERMLILMDIERLMTGADMGLLA